MSKSPVITIPSESSSSSSNLNIAPNMEGQQDILRHRDDNQRDSDHEDHQDLPPGSLAAPLALSATPAATYEERMQALEARIFVLECQAATNTAPPLLAVDNNDINSAVDVSVPSYFDNDGNFGSSLNNLGQREPVQLASLQSDPVMQYGEWFDDAGGYNAELQDSRLRGPGSGSGSGSGPNDLGMNALGYFDDLPGTNLDVVSSVQAPSDNAFLTQLLEDDLNEPDYQMDNSIPSAALPPVPLVRQTQSPRPVTVRTRFHCTFPNCNSSFGRKGDRDRHALRHGAPRFPCPFPGCVRGGANGFWRNDKLTEHRRTHQH